MLMTALYRTGQQAQALDCYRNATVRIRSALDTEPGPELKELRQRIQDRDPLLLTARPEPGQDPLDGRPRHPAVNNLPMLPGNFVGRDHELDQLITAVTVFDVYEGKGIDDTKKSVAIAVTIQPREKTLTDQEIDAVAARIVAEVNKKTGGVLR